MTRPVPYSIRVPSDDFSRHRRAAPRSRTVSAASSGRSIRTDFKTRYHGTIGGFVWALLKPLTMFLVLMAVFSFVFAANAQYKLDLIIGLFLYEFFQEATRTGSCRCGRRAIC